MKAILEGDLVLLKAETENELSQLLRAEEAGVLSDSGQGLYSGRLSRATKKTEVRTA